MARFVYVFLIFVSFSSCTKRWTKPVGISFEMAVLEPTGVNEVVSSKFSIDKLKLFGPRSQAADASANRNINSFLDGASCVVNLPQGGYESLSVNLISEATQNGIQIIGKHNWVSGGFINFQFFYSESIVFHNNFNGKEIDLVHGRDRTGSIQLDLDLLFSQIPEDLWLNATTTSVGGAGNILITEQDNPDLFWAFVTNLESSLTANID